MSEFEQLQKTVAAIQNQLSALEKKLSEISPNPITEPIEPKPVKLPVTIEERDEYCNTLVDGKRTFSHVEQKFAVLHKKTYNKISAFSKLWQIAEAQNEIAERGEQVYCAYLTGKEIIIDRNRILLYGQIPFHSEQGLLDCIEANKELWMDLLKLE